MLFLQQDFILNICAKGQLVTKHLQNVLLFLPFCKGSDEWDFRSKGDISPVFTISASEGTLNFPLWGPIASN
jgi:hypothetical protein